MQQHGIALGRRGKARAVEPEIGRALRRIAERQPAEDAVALDRMQIVTDAMADVVEHRGERLADAGRVVAVAASVREAGENGGTQQSLAVDDLS